MSLFVNEDVNEQIQNNEPEKTIEQAPESNEEQNIQDEADHDIQVELLPHLNDDEPLIPLLLVEPEITPLFPERTVNCTLPLKYQREIAEDLLTKDGLLILGRGLGWDIISANLLHALMSPVVTLHDSRNQPVSKRSLIILLNGRSDEVARIKEEFIGLHWLDNDFDSEPEFVEITIQSHNTIAKRQETYKKGGVISVSSRMLVVDLFSGALPANDITGLFILHADRVRETSNEASIINLFRDGNDWGFIKAISDEPESITGFSPLATTLRTLRLRNVFLWPRFHVSVSQSLSFRGKTQRQKEELQLRRNVTEINVHMTTKMKKIQSAILECIRACLLELKRHNPLLASDYWDMANAHDPKFVDRIHLSLKPHWHRMTYTSKQLVYDLRTLTELLKDLVSVDSLTFYQEVQGILDMNMKNAKSSNGANTVSISPWLNLDESATIISLARERALGKIKVERRRYLVDSEVEETMTLKEDYALEELPKWEQLGLLIDDILHEKSINQDKNGCILIMCSSAKSVQQIQLILQFMKKDGDRISFRGYMALKLQSYQTWREVSNLIKQINKDDQSDNGPAKDNNTPSSEEEAEDDPELLNITKTFSRNGHPASKRRRTRGASAAARVTRLYSGSNAEKNNEAVEIDETIVKKLEAEIEVPSDSESEIEKEVDNSGGFFVPEYTTRQITLTHNETSKQIIIQCYNDRTNDALLQELPLSYIIMYEPNLSFIRRVEIYQAINKENPAKTFFMYYGTSVEEEKHLLRIKKEKEAFTRLIREKASLGKHFETAQDNYKFKIDRKQVLNTRIAGGANFRTESSELQVLVDVREFRSDLPNLLYRVGISVKPLQITVGDYILSPKICVERKAIPDLIQSLNSGRLLQQCEQMLRYYEVPTLLIEFDEGKSFSLDPFTEYRYHRSTNPTQPYVSIYNKKTIQAKIMLLLIAFPRLKIIWSSSPYETAQIFVHLKANQEEPDIESAVNKGVNKFLATDDGGPPIYNEGPIDLIQSIPGINKMNYESIILKVKNIHDLVKLDKETFQLILGNENGSKAYEFINKEVGK